jgi:aminodeoxychorismate synthase component I
VANGRIGRVRCATYTRIGNLYNARVPHPIHLRLDSSHPQPGAWPYIGCPPSLLLRCENDTRICSLTRGAEVLQTWDAPPDALDWMEQHALNLSEGSQGRWIGYLSYDLGRVFEDLPSTATDDLKLPLFEFCFCEHADNDGSQVEHSTRTPPPAPPVSNFTRESYCRAVARVLDYIRAGDVFQVNLSQRFTLETNGPATAVYDRLRRQTPAWYGALLDFGTHALLCNSPELFLRVESDRRVTTRPVKGTRRLSPGLDIELRNSEKDRAELNMIVDLERNDLGRVCEVGSIRVIEPRLIEAHPTVYHGTATIEGRLRQDVSLSDLLRATFPGGSVTGAPKIRAMQIIEELEALRRGPYCGAIGYLAPGGRMEFNVAIRTMILNDGLVHIPVGGGIVADSQPESEYEETLVKASAMFSAVNVGREVI